MKEFLFIRHKLIVSWFGLGVHNEIRLVSSAEGQCTIHKYKIQKKQELFLPPSPWIGSTIIPAILRPSLFDVTILLKTCSK